MLEVTLRKALLLWRQYFRFIAVITLLTETPDILARYYLAFLSQTHSPIYPWMGMTHGILIGPILYSISSAAILGLFANGEGMKSFAVVSRSVTDNMWTLYRLFWLIAIIIGVAMIPVGFLLAFLRSGTGALKLIPVVIIGLYILLIKYSLAYPLAVVEQMEARTALRRSWEMTKGHFWYVFRCYLFLGLSLFVLRWIANALITGRPSDSAHPSLFTELFMALPDKMWLIFSWCMYCEIKTIDAEQLDDEGEKQLNYNEK